MDDSIRDTFPDGDRQVLGPFLGNLPPEILDVVVKDLGWSQTTFAFAGKACRELVKRVRDTSAAPRPKFLCEYAAQEGHLGVLRWARQNGCPWNEETCAYAARGGHLEVLLWARLEGCPWNEWTCAYAARGGHFEVLKWARESDCPWDEETCAYAARNGHLEVL